MHEHDRPLLLRTRAILTPSASLHRRADDKPVRWASQSQKRHARWRERDVIRTSMKASKGLKTDRGGGASEADPCHAYLFDSSPQLPSRRAAELRHGGPSCRRALAATIPADFPKPSTAMQGFQSSPCAPGGFVSDPSPARRRRGVETVLTTRHHPPCPGESSPGVRIRPGKEGGQNERERERETRPPPPRGGQRGEANPRPSPPVSLSGPPSLHVCS